MKISTEKLIGDLKELTQSFVDKVQSIKYLETNQLNWKENDAKWSILECLEHLNLYGDFYLKEIESSILNTRYNRPADEFKSGFLGNYFANSMLPKNGKITNKMKTFKDKDPRDSNLERTVIDRFFKQQKRMLELLDMSQNVNLNKVKTGISITQLIRLKLGDTFRFVIYHNLRHFVQIENILKRLKVEV